MDRITTVIVLIIGIALVVVLEIRKSIKKKHQAKQSVHDAEKKREEDIPGYYTIIKDAGLEQEIPYETYAAYIQKGETPKDAAEILLDEHKKFIGIDGKWGPDELLLHLKDILPALSYSFEGEPSYTGAPHKSLPIENVNGAIKYVYKGEICGVPIDETIDVSHFVADVLNPIISEKLGVQLLFALPGSDDFSFFLAQNDRVDRLKSNRYFTDGGTYEDVEKWYDYR